MGDDDHRHSLFGQFDHDIQNSRDHFRVQRRSRLVEQHHLGFHAQAAGDRHPLLLSTRQLGRIFVGLLGDVYPIQVMHRQVSRLGPRRATVADRTQRQVIQDGHVREQVETLKHHADLAADLLDILHVRAHLGTVDHDGADLMRLELIDAADHGGFSRPRRTADHNLFAFANGQVDVMQSAEIVVPFTHAAEFDQRTGESVEHSGVS